MKRSVSIKEFIQEIGIEDVRPLMKNQSRKFEKTFGFKLRKEIEISLYFESNFDRIDVYQELKFNPDFRKLYTVKYDPHNEGVLCVSGQATLFDYLGSREPNLLTLSRLLNVDFKVSYVQPYSNTTFKGEVVNGELLGRQCIVQVNDVLPELSLGLLNQIGKDETELDLLLTRIIPFQSTVIL